MELNPEGSTMILRRTNPPAPPTCPLPCGLARLQTHPWLDSVPIRAAFFRPQESSHKSPLRTPPPIPCRALLLAVEMSQFPSPHRQFPGSFHHSCHRVAVVIPIQGLANEQDARRRCFSSPTKDTAASVGRILGECF
uniref:Uncharacterized protein n=1 Tax=Setaria viridis TaxID=4556 RepID=A0A4U6SWE8_SETVI|nr:hypothetical protein SEVIR_9G161900v2 [Setaria viridis]